MYDEAAGVLSAVDYPRPTHPAWFSQYSNSFRVKAGTVVIFSTYVVSLTMPMYYPCIVPILDDLQITNWGAFSSYMYLFISSIMYGVWAALSNQFGRRKIFLAILLGYISSTFITSITYNLSYLMIIRALTAFFGAGVLPLSKFILFEILPPSMRGYILGILLINPFVTILIGPLISGLITQYFFWEATFPLLSLLATAAFLSFLFLVPETINKNKKEWTNPFAPIILIFQNFELVAVVLLVAIETSCVYFVYLMIAVDFPGRFNLQPIYISVCYLVIGAAYLSGGIPGTLLTALLRKRFDFGGRLIPTVLLFIILAVANASIGLTLEYLDSASVTIFMVFICCFVRSLMFPGAFSYCIELKPQNAFTIIDGLLMLQMFFSFLSQLIGSFVGFGVHYEWVFGVISIIMLLSGIPVALVLFKRLILQHFMRT